MRAAAFGAALLGTLVVGAVLRLAVAGQSLPAQPGGDELYYLGTAINIAEGRGHFFNRSERAFRPPAWSFGLAPLVDLEAPRFQQEQSEFLVALSELDPFHPDPELVAFLGPPWRLALWLSVLWVPLTALLGRILFDARTGLLAGALAALYPTLVASSHSLMSETLFGALLCGGLALAVASHDRRSPALAACAGLVLGATALTRELGLLVAAVCAAWSLWHTEPGRRRGAGLRAVLLCAGALAVVAPWTWRNAELFGRLVPVSTVGWFAAGEGNTLERPDWHAPHGPRRQQFKVEYFSLEGEMERADFARAHTLRQIRAEQPLWLPRKLARNLGLLWTPDTHWLQRIRDGAYPGPSRNTGRALLLGHTLFYALVFCGAWVGVLAAGRGRRASLLLWLLIAVSLVHVAANSTPRFRAPWLPLLLIYASHAALAWRAGSVPRHAWLGALLGLAFLLFASGLYFLDGAAAIWSAAAR